MTNKKNEKDNYSSFLEFDGLENIVDIDEEEELEEVNLHEKKVIDNRRSGIGSNKKMMSTTKGPIDAFVSQKLEKVVQLWKEGKIKQSSINDVFDKKKRESVCQYIGRFFYQAKISFNCANLDSFKWMVKAIGQCGPHMKPPSYYELRVPILQKEVEYTKNLLKDHNVAWMKYGVSISLMRGQIEEIKP